VSISRQERIYGEFKLALSQTRADDLRTWGRESSARLPKIALRRVKNLGGLVVRLTKATGKELVDAYGAWRRGKFGMHVGDRTAAGIDGSIGVAAGISNAAVAVGSTLFADPKKNAPDVFALALGFYMGSGGVDGNGGIPDTDLALGIGWHRSVFTHSIISGIVVEGAILAVADFADVVCAKLPVSERDPFWDQLVETKRRIANGLVKGTSAGIAYHLGVDATLQPGTYHGLPFELRQEVHNSLFALNGIAEGIDVGHKEQTPGKRVVKFAAGAGNYVRGAIANLANRK